jgi:hypothetical protein
MPVQSPGLYRRTLEVIANRAVASAPDHKIGDGAVEDWQLTACGSSLTAERTGSSNFRIADGWLHCHPTIVDVRYGLHALPSWTILRAAAINWRGVMARKYIDCREFPNDANCTLAISGTEQEVLDAAVMHAVSVHGHENAPELRETLRGILKDTPEARASAAA